MVIRGRETCDFGFYELPLLISNHVYLIPQLFILRPGYCQKGQTFHK